MRLHWIRSLVQRGAFSPDAPPGRWTLGRLAPLVLCGWLALDVALRFPPPERLGVSPFAAAARSPGRHAPYRPGLRIESDGPVVGEGALTANVEPTELRPPLTFSTNSLGYRSNPERRPGESPDVLVLWGDSFIYGSNLSDDETLPAALTRESGLPAFNLGRSHLYPLRMADVDWVLRNFRERPRLAVLVHLEHHNRDVREPGPGMTGRLARLHPALGGLRRFRPAERRLVEETSYAMQRAEAWWGVSPLKNATRRLFRKVSNDELLPNEHKENVHRLATPSGRRMLFRQSELHPVERPRSTSTLLETADFLTLWRDDLEARGMETLVLLLPTRYSVYAPWIEADSVQPAVDRAAADLYRLEAELALRGMRTVNGLTVFRQTAERELRTGRMSYYREDNHWTPLGVERIAGVLADSLAAMRPLAGARDLTQRADALKRRRAEGAHALQ